MAGPTRNKTTHRPGDADEGAGFTPEARRRSPGRPKADDVSLREQSRKQIESLLAFHSKPVVVRRLRELFGKSVSLRTIERVAAEARAQGRDIKRPRAADRNAAIRSGRQNAKATPTRLGLALLERGKGYREAALESGVSVSTLVRARRRLKARS